MELLVVCAVVFFGLLAYSPDALVKIGLVLAWGGGLLALLVAIAQGALRLAG